MAKPFVIRSMAIDDIEPIMTIAANLSKAPHWPRSAYEVIFVPESAPERIALVAEVDGPLIAGFLIVALIPPQAELESIAVTAKFQRWGMARQLFDALLGELRKRDCSEILLEVRESNSEAYHLYTALGFVETVRRHAYYCDPIEGAILMSRQLK
jgi:ribosomal-protein-alanine N-acetyltransferase